MMDAGLLLQQALVGLAVVASAVYVFVTRFPAQFRRLRIGLALVLLRSPHAFASRLGRRLAPAPTATRCGGCDGCD